MAISLTIVVFTVALLSRYDVAGGHGNRLFDERGWARAGRFLTEHMDPAKKPCEDFYEHVCGKFGLEREDGEFLGALDQQDQAMGKNVRELMKKLVDDEKEESSGGVKQFIHRFYHQCVSIQGDGQDLRENLYPASNATAKELLSIIGGGGNAKGESEATGRWRVLGGLWRDFRTGDLRIDQNNTTGYEMLFVPQINGNLGVLMGALAALNSEQKEEGSKVLSFEQLLSLVPNIQWRAFFDEILGAGTTLAWLNDADSGSGVIFEVVGGVAALNDMGRGVNEMDSALFSVIVGESVRRQLERTLTSGNATIRQRCLKNVFRYLPDALGVLYLQSIGSSASELRQDILTVKRNVFTEFQFLLNSVDWLDERDKEKVHSKLDEVRFFPGIPDVADDDEKLIESLRDFTYDNQSIPFSAEIAWLKAAYAKSVHSYRTGPAENIEFSVGAMNALTFNKVIMSFGMTLPPFYDTKYPMAVKYGGIGSVIGHELIHSFDELGLTRPSLAHKHDWLSEGARREFEKQQACLIKEYSKFCHPDKAFCVSGEKNIGENMADVDGLEVAYTAFKFAKQVHGEDPAIPSMLNYTDDQLFFMANARLWCARGWDEGMRTDPHSPPKARVDVTVANNPTFSRSFQCTAGSKYAPFKTCSVWGELANPAANFAAAAARKRRSSGGK